MTIRELRDELNNLIENEGFGDHELLSSFNIFDYMKDENEN